MPSPQPIWLYHFTRIEHLASIARDGLCCDMEAHQPGRLSVEVGHLDIKERRRRRPVPLAPGGVVADYAPFYFAPRSPMLYRINAGDVTGYRGGQHGIVYLCTTLQRVRELELCWLGTDRNATLNYARFFSTAHELYGLVDWELMRARIWHNTDTDPQRRERRMAELLVHQRLPWEAIQFIGTRNAADLQTVRSTLGTLAVNHLPQSDVRGDWYF